MEAQNKRPSPLTKPMIPTMVAAVSGDMFAASCAIGDATLRRPMPQVILVNNIHHNVQNCQVFIATLAVVGAGPVTEQESAFCISTALIIFGGAKYRAEGIIISKYNTPNRTKVEIKPYFCSSI